MPLPNSDVEADVALASLGTTQLNTSRSADRLRTRPVLPPSRVSTALRAGQVEAERALQTGSALCLRLQGRLHRSCGLRPASSSLCRRRKCTRRYECLSLSNLGLRIRGAFGVDIDIGGILLDFDCELHQPLIPEAGTLRITVTRPAISKQAGHMQNGKILVRIGGPLKETDCSWKILRNSEAILVEHTQMIHGSRSASISGLLKVAQGTDVVRFERLAVELATPDQGAAEHALCNDGPRSSPFFPIANAYGHNLSGPTSEKATRFGTAG
jgi:hypothetical protein